MSSIPSAVCILVRPCFRFGFYLSHRSESSALFPGRLQAPGGKVDHPEHPLDAAVRELREETGLRIRPARFTYVTERVVRDEGGHYRVFAYTVTLRPWEFLRRTEPAKASRWKLWSMPEVNALHPSLALPSLPELIRTAYFR